MNIGEPLTAVALAITIEGREESAWLGAWDLAIAKTILESELMLGI